MGALHGADVGLEGAWGVRGGEGRRQWTGVLGIRGFIRVLLGIRGVRD